MEDIFEAAREGDVATVERLLTLKSVLKEKKQEKLEAPETSGNETTGGILRMNLNAFRPQDLEIEPSSPRFWTVDVNKRDPNGWTVLHHAASCGRTEVAEVILRRADVKVNLFTKINGHSDIVKMLVTHKEIDLSTVSVNEKFTALHLCALRPILDYSDTVKAFIKALYARGIPESEFKSIVNARDVYGRTALHYAASKYRVLVVQELLSCPTTEVNILGGDGCSPLHLASWEGHAEIVSALLKHNDIDPNLCTKVDLEIVRESETVMSGAKFHKVPPAVLSIPHVVESPQTALSLAMEKNPKYIARVVVDELVKHPRTDVFKDIGNSLSAVDVALKKCDRTSLEIMLDNKELDLQTCTKYLKDILTYAKDAKLQYKAVADFFLEKVWSAYELRTDRFEETGKLFFTKFHVLVCANLKELLHVLLQFSYEDYMEELNGVDNEWQTPLHYAVLMGSTQVVEILLSHEKLQANAEDKWGRTALQIAIQNDKQIIEKLILQRPDVKDNLDRLYRDRQVYVDAANAILVGAALIASVTFAGWLQPPLGYIFYYEFLVPDPAPPGTYESYAAIKQCFSIRVFWLFNSLSFFFAMATVLAGAGAVLPMPDTYIGVEVRIVRKYLLLTSILLISSILFVLVAFGAAGFAVLPPIISLETNMITTCVIGSILCTVILGLFMRRLYHMRPSWWRSIEAHWPCMQITKDKDHWVEKVI